MQFTEHTISTITVSAAIKNFNCHEDELPVICMTNKTVVEIVSNFCERIDPDYADLVEKNKTRQRRHKKKQKKVKKIRKMQGNGKYINSQTTFYVLPPFDGIIRRDGKEYSVMRKSKLNKPYKMKLFRTGAIQIPGILRADMMDAYYVIDEVIKVLNDAFGEEPGFFILEEEPKIVMMNYIWRIKDIDVLLDLNNLSEELKKYNKEDIYIDKIEVIYNPEKYQGLLCKLKKENDPNIKFTTLKIFSSGKINATFKTNTDDVVFIKDWFSTFLVESESIYKVKEESECEIDLEIFDDPLR